MLKFLDKFKLLMQIGSKGGTGIASSGTRAWAVAHGEYWPFDMALWVVLSKKSVRLFKGLPDVPF